MGAAGELRGAFGGRPARKGLPVVRWALHSDGSLKFLLESAGDLFEATCVPEGKRGWRMNLSSQVGCGVGCRFCATGLQGFARNLTAKEMLGQVSAMSGFLASAGSTVPAGDRDFGVPPEVLRSACADRSLSSVWLAAQGEPLLDVAAVGEALEALRERFGASTLLGVATCAPPEGLAEAARWAASGLLDAASVTLHSAVQPVRDEMMPGASIWPLPQVRDALCVARLPRLEITAALEEGVNAGEGHLRALADFCKGLECTAVLSAMLSPQGHPLAFPRTLRLAEGMLRAAGVSACVRPFRPCRVVTGCPKA